MNGSLTYRRGSTNDLKIGMSDQRPPSKPRKSSDASVPTRPATRPSRHDAAGWPGAVASGVATGAGASAGLTAATVHLDLADFKQRRAGCGAAGRQEWPAAAPEPADADEQRIGPWRGAGSDRNADALGERLLGRPLLVVAGLVAGRPAGVADPRIGAELDVDPVLLT